jgi:hypothetical protein
MDIDVKGLVDDLKDLLTLDGRQRIFERNQELKSSFLKEPSNPEAVTKDVLIEPVIRALGLQKLPEKHFYLPQGKKRMVDYRLKNNANISFLVEAKPLNANLFDDTEDSAVNQIKELFYLAVVKEEYAFGIATDGIHWVFINKEREIVNTYDIRKELPKVKELLIGRTDISLQKEEEEISKKFYDWYNALLHGGKYKDHNGKIRNISVNDCLIENILLVREKNDKEQIAQSILNRLIFIKFLQSKEIIQQDILGYLSGLDETKLNDELRQLFFEVLNTEKGKRSDVDVKFRDIPYLNGSLFVRTEIERSNSDYKIKAEILKEIIAFLDSFRFVHEDGRSDDNALDPEILGYIFEKAMTAVERNSTGAYYTPKTITEYLSKNTIEKKIVERANTLLEQRKQKSITDIDGMYKLDIRIQKDIFNGIVTNLTVCDNACGSGSFLLSAANMLLDVYKVMNEIASIGYSEIELKKLILKHSLYGVDINPNAIEIAKLRLWLWLVASYSKENIEPLTNIEYNIRTGNSLIGYLGITKIRDKLSLRDWIVRDGSNSLKVLLNRREREITEYKSLSGSKAKELKEKIEERDREIRDLLDAKLYEEVSLHKKIGIEEYKTLKPFHWGFEFGEIFNEKNGFDVIVGNPPYGNILTNAEKKVLYNFETINANEIAANFIERTISLLAAHGIAGLIVANSIAINSGTSKARELIRKNMSESRMALFGTRPAKMFADAEIRVLVFLGEKDSPEQSGVIYTTEAIKFTTEQKPRLLDHLSFESTDGLTLGKSKIGDNLEDASLPKVGRKTIRNILIKFREGSKYTLKDKIDRKKFNYKLQFRKTGGYWLNALEKMPYTSTKIETIKFENALERDFTILLINSSLFYLYWSTYGNLRDFPLTLLEKFPFPEYEVLQTNKKKVDLLKMQITTNLLKAFIADRGRVGEFRTGMCKDTIDEIDELLGKIYGLSKNEIAFVKNYDTHIRRYISLTTDKD